MAFIGELRQVGKTTLALPLLVFDEVHKYAR